MRWSLRIARIGGTEVRIHFTFILFLIWLGTLYYMRGGAQAAWEGIGFILLLFTCVVLHEFGHAIAARFFGVHTPSITLLPIGGVARLQRMPDKPHQELVVALAGPLVNVLIAGALWIYLGPRIDLTDMESLADPRTALWVKLAVVNVFLVLFNLIPAFPMDGGRVLRSGLAMLMPYGRATVIAARIGQTFAIGFGILGFFYNPFLIFIAVFIFLAASQEAAAAQVKDLTRKIPIRDVVVTQLITLPADATIDQAVELLLHSTQHEFPVLGENNSVLGVLTREDMMKALKETGPKTPVVEAMHRNLPVIGIDDDFEEVFRLMQESNAPALPVVNSSRQFLGLITPENIGELMMVHSASASRAG